MDLFVINRHVGDEDSSINVPQIELEKQKLDQTLKRIEKNRQIRKKQKDRDQKIKDAIEKTKKVRKLKRELKQKKESVIPVSTSDTEEFLDEKVASDSGELTNEELQHEGSNIGEPVSQYKNPKRKKMEKGDIKGFTILGVDSFTKKSKVKRVLPRWLTNPTVISVNLEKLESKVSDMTILDQELRDLLQSNGVSNFFPVQREVIPWLIQSSQHSDVIFPRDICVSAPTGSGKTLAFVLPVIQSLKKYNVKKIRALVILPTQDLARQVFTAFKTYSEGTKIDICLLTGQTSFEVEQSQLVYKNAAFGYLTKVDILVCTAGRLVDHLKQTEGFELKALEFLIIDEADRVLDTVQNDWLYHLEKHIFPEGSFKVLNQFNLQKRRPPQKLLFSATLSQDPEKLQQLSLFQPKLFTSIVETSEESSSILQNVDIASDKFIGKYTTPKELTERYIEASSDLKPLVLYKFIKQEKLKKTLVFTHSVESAHRLTILLKAMFKNKLNIQEISSHLQTKHRVELINQFSEGKIDILISTDSLARGIDLPGVQCVISYSAPKYLKSYIHRAGRTARAGEKGLAVTVLHSSQLSKFKSLLKQAKKYNVEEIKISDEDLEPLGERYKESLEKLKEAVEKEETVDLKKLKSAKSLKLKLKKRQNRLKQIKDSNVDST